MSWKIFVPAFVTIFLAELGDKTQLASISLAAQSKSPLWVFLGAMAAFGAVTLIGVTLGVFLTRFIPESYIRIASGLIFIIIGTLTLLNKI